MNEHQRRVARITRSPAIVDLAFRRAGLLPLYEFPEWRRPRGAPFYGRRPGVYGWPRS